MSNDTDRLVVITGGPGAGKTTLIDALARRGLATSPESGRAVIRQQRAAGGDGLPWADRAPFAELMFAFDRDAYRTALALPGPVVFDRGLPDVVGYLRLCGLAVPTAIDRAARELRYRREVFVAPPWAKIFENDSERRQDFDEARRTHDVLVGVYRDYGYELVTLPCAGVDERVAMLLACVGAAAPKRGTAASEG